MSCSATQFALAYYGGMIGLVFVIICSVALLRSYRR